MSHLTLTKEPACPRLLSLRPSHLLTSGDCTGSRFPLKQPQLKKDLLSLCCSLFIHRARPSTRAHTQRAGAAGCRDGPVSVCVPGAGESKQLIGCLFLCGCGSDVNRICMWGQRSTLGVISQDLFILLLETRSFTGTQSLLIRSRWQASVAFWAPAPPTTTLGFLCYAGVGDGCS